MLPHVFAVSGHTFGMPGTELCSFLLGSRGTLLLLDGELRESAEGVLEAITYYGRSLASVG